MIKNKIKAFHSFIVPDQSFPHVIHFQPNLNRTMLLKSRMGKGEIGYYNAQGEVK